MARLFVELCGQRYEKKFKGQTRYYVDERGREVGAAVAKALDQARAPKVNAAEATRPRKPERAVVELTESTSVMRESAQLRYRALRKRQANSTQISESERHARRRDILMTAGMGFTEASIAARGRYERG
jgi:hypothetical protein